jgi:hypothetical protein
MNDRVKVSESWRNAGNQDTVMALAAVVKKSCIFWDMTLQNKDIIQEIYISAKKTEHKKECCDTKYIILHHSRMRLIIFYIQHFNIYQIVKIINL